MTLEQAKKELREAIESQKEELTETCIYKVFTAAEHLLEVLDKLDAEYKEFDAHHIDPLSAVPGNEK